MITIQTTSFTAVKKYTLNFPPLSSSTTAGVPKLQPRVQKYKKTLKNSQYPNQ